MKRNIDLSGGGAAALSPTFLGCAKEESKTSHLTQPTQICLKFKRISTTDKYSPSLEIIIKGRIPSFPITIDIIEDTKALKVIIAFKRPEDLDKAKGLLKTLEIPFTDKGKTSNRKPEFSVIQPKKGEQKEESDEHLETFPLDIIGDHHRGFIEPMLQPIHKFLHPSIRLRLSEFQIDDNTWRDLCKLSVYQKHDIDSTCVPHPNNPESQKEVVQMQQLSTDKSETRKNWKNTGFIWVPKKIMEIPAYWISNCFGVVEEISQHNSEYPVSSHVSPYSVFDPSTFLQILREREPMSVHSEVSHDGHSFWLKDTVIDELYERDTKGNLMSKEPKVRYSQMIQVNAYQKNSRIDVGALGGESFPGFHTRVTPGNILIVYPSRSIESLVKRMSINGEIIRYNYIGKILIPHQFLRNMPDVWVNLQRSSYNASH